MSLLGSLKIISILALALSAGCQDPEAAENLTERAKAIATRLEKNESDRLEGIVRMFNKEKGYGFIEIGKDGGGTERSIYFDYASIAGMTYNQLEVGDRVTFNISVDESEPKARSVSIVLSREESNAVREAFAREQAYIASYCNPGNEIECKIRRAVAASLGIPFQKAESKASYVDDLKADSLHIVEIVMALEVEFDLEIPDEDLELMPTVGDTIDYIARRK